MNIPERFEDGRHNPFSIEYPKTWQQIQTLLELHSHGETDYDVEMRRRAVRALLDWAKPDVDADEPWNQAPADTAERICTAMLGAIQDAYQEITTGHLVDDDQAVKIPLTELNAAFSKLQATAWAANTEAAPAGGEAPPPIGSFDEWVTQAAIVTGRLAQALSDFELIGCTDSARDATMRGLLPVVEHLAAEFRRLVERAGSQTGDDLPW